MSENGKAISSREDDRSQNREARICTECVENEPKEKRQELKLDRKIGVWSKK